MPDLKRFRRFSAGSAVQSDLSDLCSKSTVKCWVRTKCFSSRKKMAVKAGWETPKTIAVPTWWKPRTGGAESDGLTKKKLTATPLWERCICFSASRHGGIKNGVADAISYWKFTFEHVRCLKKKPSERSWKRNRDANPPTSCVGPGHRSIRGHFDAIGWCWLKRLTLSGFPNTSNRTTGL